MGFIMGKRGGFLSENLNLSDFFARFLEQSEKSFLINRGTSLYVKIPLFNNWIPDANKKVHTYLNKPAAVGMTSTKCRRVKFWTRMLLEGVK